MGPERSRSKKRRRTPPLRVPCAKRKTSSMAPEFLLVDAHRQALQTQLAHRAAIDRRKIRIADVRFRKARQQPRDRDGDRSAPQDVADAMVRPGAERKDALWLAVDVE